VSEWSGPEPGGLGGIKMRAHPDEPDMEICADTGCSSMAVDRAWLEQHFPNALRKSIEPAKMRTAGDPITVDELATFDIIIPGHVNGTEKLGHQHHSSSSLLWDYLSCIDNLKYRTSPAAATLPIPFMWA